MTANPGELVVVGLKQARFLDVASLVLLAEDISRTYEQILAGRSTFLPAPRKTYKDYVHGFAIGQQFSLPIAPESHNVAELSVDLTLLSEQGISPERSSYWEASVRFLTAALRSLSAVGGSGTAITFNPRLADRALVRTVGALSRTVPWPAGIQGNSDVLNEFEQVDQTLEKLCSNLNPLTPEEIQDFDVTINLELLDSVGMDGIGAMDFQRIFIAIQPVAIDLWSADRPGNNSRGNCSKGIS